MGLLGSYSLPGAHYRKRVSVYIKENLESVKKYQVYLVDIEMNDDLFSKIARNPIKQRI